MNYDQYTMDRTTLVFKTETKEQKQKVRELSRHSDCTAWCLEDLVMQIELIAYALDKDDIKLAKKFRESDDIMKEYEAIKHEL